MKKYFLLACLFLGLSFFLTKHANAETDTTAPEVVSLIVSPKEVDTSSQDQIITLTVRITDDSAGVCVSSDCGTYYSSPTQLRIAPIDGSITQSQTFYSFNRISGDDKDGIYTADLVLPKGSAAGEWNTQNFLIVDKAGNIGWLLKDALENKFGAGVTKVINSATFSDITPPEVLALDIAPHNFDTSSQDQTLTLSIELKDDFAGTCTSSDCNDYHYYASSPIQMLITSADGSQTNVFYQFDRISGDAKHGTYTSTATMPKGSAQGTWNIQNILLVDTIGNFKSLSQADLTALFGAETVSLVNGTVEEKPQADPPGERIMLEGPCPGGIDPNRPTIVITHGLQPENYDEVSADGNFDELFSGFSSERGREGSGWLIKEQLGCDKVNIVQFVWPEAFQGASPLGYTQALPYTNDAGLALAKYLTERLGMEYEKPIHFIGHSLGTIVNAYAARSFLEKEKNVSQAQVTILDYPRRTLIDRINEDFFAAVLQKIQDEKDLRIDNYYSLDLNSFGNKAQGMIYNHAVLNDPSEVGSEIFFIEEQPSLSKNHAGVHQWYRWTVKPEGFNPENYCDDSKPNQFSPSENLNASLDPCQEGWYWSIFGQGGWNKFPMTNTGNRIDFSNNRPVILSDPESFKCSYESGVINCKEQSSPYIIFNADFPSNAEYLSFDYRFPNMGDGDYVSVMLDGEALWTFSGKNMANPGEFSSSEPIILPGDLAEGNHKLTVALFGVGEKNAEFELKNLQTTSAKEDTARSLKRSALQNLSNAKTGDKRIDRKVNEAMERISQSLADNLWVDDNHLYFPKGVKVFKKESEAIAILNTLIQEQKHPKKKNKDAPDPIEYVIEATIRDLLSADKIIAEIAIKESNLEGKMLERAKEMMQKADEAAIQNPLRASILYGKAWFFLK